MHFKLPGSAGAGFVSPLLAPPVLRRRGCASAVKLEYESAKRTKAAANFVFFARSRAFRDPNALPHGQVGGCAVLHVLTTSPHADERLNRQPGSPRFPDRRRSLALKRKNRCCYGAQRFVA